MCSIGLESSWLNSFSCSVCVVCVAYVWFVSVHGICVVCVVCIVCQWFIGVVCVFVWAASVPYVL